MNESTGRLVELGSPEKKAAVHSVAKFEREMLLEAIPLRLIFCDEQMVIRLMNSESEAALVEIDGLGSVRKDDVVGTHLAELIPYSGWRPVLQARRRTDRVEDHLELVELGPITLELVMKELRDDDGELGGVIVSWSNVLERLRKEAEAQEKVSNAGAINKVLSSLQRVTSAEEAASTAIDAIRAAFDWVYGSYWVLDDSGHAMAPRFQSGHLGEEFERVTDTARIREGVGPDGAAWQRRDVVVISDIAGQADCARCAVALGSGARSMVVVPLIAEGSVVGLIDFFMKDEEITAARIETLQGISQILSGSLEHLAGKDAERVEMANALASASEELAAVSEEMGSTASRTAGLASEAANSSGEVSQNVDAVATAARELTASVREIARSAAEAAKVAGGAVDAAAAAQSTIGSLGASSAEIGNVVKLITSIAQQTKLLALNATIEAARAGDAGKGFAVVASEVKELARETARATEDIASRVEAIQADSGHAVEAIRDITGVIDQISGLQTTIAGAVEQQNASTNEIAARAGEAAAGVAEIVNAVSSVSSGAQSTKQAAEDTRQAAEELAEMAGRLQKLSN